MKTIGMMLAVVMGGVPVVAQTTAVAAPAIAPPAADLILNYSYWPTQFVQFVTGSELPYSLIAVQTDEGKKPVVDVVLTDKKGKRVHYTNSDGVAAVTKGLGEEAHKTEIAFEESDTQNVGSVSTVRLTMADGKPLEFRFVQGSDISEQGSGLTALAESKIPVFVYRELGAVAGEGTALKIGDVVSPAEVWTEISRPPYFVGYRGGLTQSAHTVVFAPGKESWTVVSGPAALAVGGTWELDGANGNHRTLKIDKVDGTHVMVTGNDRFAPSVRFTLSATQDGAGWSVDSVRMSPVREGDKHFATLQLTGGAVALSFGKKKPIATGTLAVTGTAADRTEVVEFTTPAWAKGKVMTEETVTAAGSVVVTAHP